MSRANEISPKNWQPAIGTDGIVGSIDDIAQCIQIILSTPIGSDPLRPTFGSNIHRYIDWPQPKQTPYLIRETFSAIRAWEKRVGEMLIAITHGTGSVVIGINWQPLNSTDLFLTEVKFGVAND